MMEKNVIEIHLWSSYETFERSEQLHIPCGDFFDMCDDPI